MNSQDTTIARQIRRSPTLRTLAGRGMLGTMQAALIATMHNKRYPFSDNPLTWNHPAHSFYAAAQTIAAAPLD